jgi:hypothetical protein
MEMTFAEYVQSKNPDLVKDLDTWELSMPEQRVHDLEQTVRYLEKQVNRLIIGFILLAAGFLCLLFGVVG